MSDAVDSLQCYPRLRRKRLAMAGRQYDKVGKLFTITVECSLAWTLQISRIEAIDLQNRRVESLLPAFLFRGEQEATSGNLRGIQQNSSVLI